MTEETDGDTIKAPPSLIHSFEGGKLTLNHHLVEDAFGSKDHGFVNGLMGQIMQMSAVNGAPDTVTTHFIGGALLELKPQNALEATLVAQIVANHILAMKFARLTLNAVNVEQMQAYEAMATKGMRTTAAQMEALHKMRHGGKQKVKVEHVHVYPGGQAIVGNVETGGRVNETEGQFHALSAAMPSDLETLGLSMQGARCER